jgi:hypothetical protein
MRKKFCSRRLVMTHARHLCGRMMYVQLAAAVLDAGRFAAAVSCGRSWIAATAADSSTATTASPSAGTPGCSNAPSDAPAENSSRIPSPSTPGFAACALRVSSLFCCLGVDFFDGLIDLDWGSWEGSLPESSSLGGDRTPLRGAFFIDSVFVNPGFKNSLQEGLYQLCGDWRHSRRHRLAAASPILVRQNGPLFRRLRQSNGCLRFFPNLRLRFLRPPPIPVFAEEN